MRYFVFSWALILIMLISYKSLTPLGITQRYMLSQNFLFSGLPFRGGTPQSGLTLCWWNLSTYQAGSQEHFVHVWFQYSYKVQLPLSLIYRHVKRSLNKIKYLFRKAININREADWLPYELISKRLRTCLRHGFARGRKRTRTETESIVSNFLNFKLVVTISEIERTHRLVWKRSRSRIIPP